MFIGYPRSGHSLVGALLDAHPNIIVAHELGTLQYVHAGFTRHQIFHLLLKSSRRSVQRGRRHGEFPLQVPGQWQGRFQRINVIGDKHGEGATLRLKARPWLFDALKDRMENVKFIHVVRNPYDNISTIYRKSFENLSESIEYYFSLCQAVLEIKKCIAKDNFFELHQESFIEDPKPTLSELCAFLGVDVPADYLDDCAGIVYASPHQSRHNVTWDPGSIEEVKSRLNLYPFLEDYAYEDECAKHPVSLESSPWK